MENLRLKVETFFYIESLLQVICRA